MQDGKSCKLLTKSWKQRPERLCLVYRQCFHLILTWWYICDTKVAGSMKKQVGIQIQEFANSKAPILHSKISFILFSKLSSDQSPISRISRIAESATTLNRCNQEICCKTKVTPDVNEQIYGHLECFQTAKRTDRQSTAPLHLVYSIMNSPQQSSTALHIIRCQKPYAQVNGLDVKEYVHLFAITLWH